MTINQASMQVSARCTTAAVKSQPLKGPPIDFDRLGEPLLLKPATWEDMFRPQVTETAEEDGSTTQTVSIHAKLAFIGDGHRGSSVLDCSISFNSASYQYGELGETADILSAAHEVVNETLKNAFSGVELEKKTLELEQTYETRKNEVATSFAQMVDGVLDGEKVQSSIRGLFVSLESKYHSLTLSSPDRWAHTSVYEATMSLRALGASVKLDGGPLDGLYSLHELEGAALKARGGLNLKT